MTTIFTKLSKKSNISIKISNNRQDANLPKASQKPSFCINITDKANKLTIFLITY